ncbi:ATP-dependent sacrificial sulfur transferase LarE [Desulfocicer niacini]
MIVQKKIQQLGTLIGGYQGIAIAFSGGVDSAFLAAMAKKNMKYNVVLLTLDSDFQSDGDTEHAIYMAGKIGLPHEIIPFDPWTDKALVKNEKNRCYICKNKGFALLRAAADRRGIVTLAHGVNTDDLSDYRPGLKAAHEQGIVSPLVDVGMSKEEIRQASREIGLETWNMPSQSCLATRIPYGEYLTMEKIMQIKHAEDHLQLLGFEGVRVRHHGLLARIECKTQDIEKISSPSFRSKITKALQVQGFKFVSVDLEGYTSGRMNRML